MAFVAVLLLTACLGVISMLQLSKVHQTSTDLSTNWLPATRSLLELKGMVSNFRSQEMAHALSGSFNEMAAYEKAMDESWAALQKKRTEYAGLISEPEEREVFPVFEKLLAQYELEHRKIVAVSHTQDTDQASNMIRGKSQQLSNEMNAALDKLTKVNLAGAVRAGETADHKEAAKAFVEKRKPSFQGA